MKNLMERALEYISTLRPGSEINDETDGPVVKDFRHLLGALLWKRRLYLEDVPGGQRVTECAPWLTRRLQPLPLPPVWCARCSRSLFDPECEHGVRYVIDLGEPDWMGAPDGAKAAMVVRPGALA